MLYIESTNVDPHFNLALEQYVFDNLDRSKEYFMLWQNDKSVIIGKNQNTVAEVNRSFINDNGIKVVRRLSGGGAVYHDLGNINFTFIGDAGKKESFDFNNFCVPIIKALRTFGVVAEVRGRNDIVIDGKKFSGNAQYAKQDRIMHHGTILFDTDLDFMRQAIAAPKDKIDSKGTKSKRSAVTNIKPHISGEISTAEFFKALRSFMFEEYGLQKYELTSSDLENVAILKESVYDTWEWNYGYSPPYDIFKERYVEGCGKFQIYMNVVDGKFLNIAFYGDYFGNRDTQALASLMTGRKADENDLRDALCKTEIGQYFHKLDLDTFISIVLQ